MNARQLVAKLLNYPADQDVVINVGGKECLEIKSVESKDVTHHSFMGANDFTMTVINAVPSEGELELPEPPAPKLDTSKSHKSWWKK